MHDCNAECCYNVDLFLFYCIVLGYFFLLLFPKLFRVGCINIYFVGCSTERIIFLSISFILSEIRQSTYTNYNLNLIFMLFCSGFNTAAHTLITHSPFSSCARCNFPKQQMFVRTLNSHHKVINKLQTICTFIIQLSLFCFVSTDCDGNRNKYFLKINTLSILSIQHLPNELNKNVLL